MSWIEITTKAPPCCAKRDDGRRCRKKSVAYDAARPGMVCAKHAEVTR